MTEVRATVSSEWLWIVDVFDDVFIIETDKGFFEAPYRVDDEKARVIGMPIRVERVVSYQPKTNAKEHNAMLKDMIINALKAVGIDHEGMDDDALLAAYNKLITDNNDDDDEGGDDAVATAVNAAVKPLQDKLYALEAKANAGDDAIKSDSIKTIIA